MNGINLNHPTTFTSSLLVCDSTQIPQGSSDGIGQLTKDGIQPVSAALEIQSTLGALLVPRMTEDERDADTFIPSEGMIIYNLDNDVFNFYEGASWIAISNGTGDVVGPGTSVTNDIAIFGDTTGKSIIDSGVPISKVPSLLGSLLSTVNQIGSLGHVQYIGDLGTVFVDSLVALQHITNDFGPDSQVCTLFTGELPSTSSSPSALVELQSTTGVLLISRLTSTQIAALTNPQNGMQVYNTTTNQFNFYENGAWVEYDVPGGNAPADATYILKTANSDLPNAQSLGTLTTGLLKNSVSGSTGTLSRANPGVDYYAPSYPTIIKDDGESIFIGLTAGNPSSSPGLGNTGIGDSCLNTLITGSGNTAYGFGADTSNSFVSYASIFGKGASIGGSYACSFGAGASASEAYNIALGAIANSSGTASLSIGYNATSTGQYSIAIGSTIDTSTSATADYSVAIGGGAMSTAAQCVTIGVNAESDAVSSIAIGGGAYSHGQNSIAIGLNSESDGLYSVSIGFESYAKSDYGIALGGLTTESANYAISIGYGGQSSGVNSISLGGNSNASGTKATAIGYSSTAPNNNTIILGSGENVGINTNAPQSQFHVKGQTQQTCVTIPGSDIIRNQIYRTISGNTNQVLYVGTMQSAYPSTLIVRANIGVFNSNGSGGAYAQTTVGFTYNGSVFFVTGSITPTISFTCDSSCIISNSTAWFIDSGVGGFGINILPNLLSSTSVFLVTYEYFYVSGTTSAEVEEEIEKLKEAA